MAGGNLGSNRVVWLRYHVQSDIGGEDGRRLEELEEAAAGRGLQSDEMNEVRRIYEAHGVGSFHMGPEFSKIGVADPNRFYENLGFILEYAEHAYENQFAMEAMALRVLLLDFVLRCYVVQMTDEPIDPSGQDRMTFGQTIDRAERHGLQADIVADLKEFNRKRNLAFHHFVLGRTDYQEVADAYRDADGLYERVIEASSMPPVDEL